ncbi:hypothetical protein [Mycobacteroides abscessus]|uniref:hypothetical protein n=1 Tax=Mycobacteroides abscessus TaxID=36809 RepID=UPI000929C9C3|nr:hypothetical protein [Mycobacteroides abscessus]SII00410.1 Uncharacterised protein [Mycobacteroides abscessus subsp. abscessus]
MTTPATALSTKDVAEKFDTDAKTLRVFLRSITYAKNAKGRYSFTPKDIAPLKRRYARWIDADAMRPEPADLTALVGEPDGGGQ